MRSKENPPLISAKNRKQAGKKTEGKKEAEIHQNNMITKRGIKRRHSSSRSPRQTWGRMTSCGDRVHYYQHFNEEMGLCVIGMYV